VIGLAFSDAAVRGGGGHGTDLQASYVGGEALLGFSCVMRNPRAPALGMAVVTIFSVGGGRPDWGWVWRSPDLTSSPSSELGMRGCR
jgi:hypothetical protein